MESVVTPTADSAATPEPAVASTLIDSEGNFSEGWRDNFLPEELRGEHSLTTFHNFEGMAKQLIHAQKMTGKDKYVLPTDASGDDEWDAHWNLHGRPETKEGYELTYPEDMPVEQDMNLVGTWMEYAHKKGLSQNHAADAYDFYNSVIKSAMADAAANTKIEQQKLSDDMVNLWGNALKANKHIGNMAIEKGTEGDAELKARLVEKYGNDPDFIRYSYNLGNQFVESGAVQTGIQKVDTPADIEMKINELKSNPAFMERNHPSHNAIVEQISQLYKEKNKVA